MNSDWKCFLFAGCTMCALSSFPYLDEYMEKDTQFYLAFFGQLVNSVGHSLSDCLPTKVSQAWFGDSERIIATGIMTMTNALGAV